MDSKDEVHSDGSEGSYELVDVENNVGLSDEDSYDMLSSDMSDTPGEEDVNSAVNEDNITEQIESFSHDQPNDDPAIEDSDNSDFSESGEVEAEEEEVEEEFEEEEVEEEFEEAEVEEEFEEEEVEEEEEEEQSYHITDNKGKKRTFTTMANEHSYFDYHIFPPHIKLKEDATIKEMAKDHILRFLPAKSLARCRVVSKEWNSWISSPFFTHTQSQHFSQTSGFFQNEKDKPSRFITLDRSSYGVPQPSLKFLPQKVSIKSSCNGLLLCQGFNDQSEFYICNPANKQFIKLPDSEYYHGEKPKMVLAFEPSSLNFDPFYQVICPFFVHGDGPILYFDIYDSNTKAWRVSEDICVELDAYCDLKKGGVFVNGIVYWELTDGKLLAFDLKNEIHSVQTLVDGGALLKVNGEVCYVKGRYRNSNKMCELDVYDGLMSLKSTLKFGVSLGYVQHDEVVECRVLGNPRDDVIAVDLKKSMGQSRLYVYHVKDQKVEGPVCLQGSKKLFPYVNSLVSIAV